MQRVKVNQSPVPVPERQEHSENRNWFDGLSHSWKASFTMGKLVPFLTLLALPNDYFKIRAEVMMRFAPLYLPVMHRVNLALEYYYVPYRIIWRKETLGNTANSSWEDFIMGKDETALTPFINYTAIDYQYGTQGELPMYMGVPTIIEDSVGLTYTIPINALNIAAYYDVYDQWYRNDQLQSPINASSDIVNGAVDETEFSNAPAQSLSCAYRNWGRDLFTSCTFEPQQGAPVQIPMFDEYQSPDSGVTFRGPFRWRQVDTFDPAGNGDLFVNGGNGDLGATTVTNDPGNQVYLDIQEHAADIAAFRFASVYQEFLERSLRTGDKISDYYPAFWHTDPYKGTLQVPEFLGSKKGRVVISEVLSTAETVTLKVGSYAGQAIALESTGDTIEYHCLEHGVILGIVSVYPDTGYYQGLERMWSYGGRLDYPDPRFALIGDEEVKNKEVQYTFQTALLARNDEIFGYRERNLDSRFKNDTVAGLMRTVLNSFHLGRLFNPTDPENLTNGSVLNSLFLQCKPRITDVFQVVEGEDEIYAHIFNDIKVQRMLPKFGIPQL